MTVPAGRLSCWYTTAQMAASLPPGQRLGSALAPATLGGPRPEAPLRYQRVVAKVGTTLLTGGGPQFDRERLADLVRQLAVLRARGCDVLLVTSGAIAVGRARLRQALASARRPPEPGAARRQRQREAAAATRDIATKQVLAALGQGVLMQMYDQLCAVHGLLAAQTLLTRGDLRHRQGYLNTRNTLLGLLECGALPIINENDVVATEEIRFGDNDNLSALVANLVDADLLCLLTDVGGLYTADPRRYHTAQLIPEVARIDRATERLAGGEGSSQGTGGMYTKIEAAKLATATGATVVVAPGREPDVLVRLAQGEAIGTRFLPSASRYEARSRWILSGLAHGTALSVDAGAAEALAARGRSLLPAGVTRVEGRFRRGDPVAILDPSGRRIACGLTNYDSSAVDQIRGLHSEAIEAALGYTYGEEVVHRNNLVLFTSDEY